MNAEVLLVVITNPGCPDLRLPEWISRRREQHRNCRLDTRPVSQTRCPVGCGLQFSRRLFSRYQSSSNDRQRHDPFGRCESVRRDRWIIRRDYLGPSDMWWGLPTSSSHALIGGYAGAAMMHAALHTGWRSSLGVIISSGWYKTLLFIVVAPVLGMVLGLVFMTSVYRIFQRRPPRQIDKWFRKAQLFSAACYSLGHGGNDAQKTMGVVAGALYTAGFMSKEDVLGTWGHFRWPIILAEHAAIAAGTYSGGWRIVRTMGQKITKLKPVGGFCAESAGALTLFGTAWAGIPVSTTHAITGAIVGVGAVHRFSAVRWGVARRIVWAWIVTIPASALMAGVTFGSYAHSPSRHDS